MVIYRRLRACSGIFQILLLDALACKVVIRQLLLYLAFADIDICAERAEPCLITMSLCLTLVMLFIALLDAGRCHRFNQLQVVTGGHVVTAGLAYVLLSSGVLYYIEIVCCCVLRIIRIDRSADRALLPVVCRVVLPVVIVVCIVTCRICKCSRRVRIIEGATCT